MTIENIETTITHENGETTVIETEGFVEFHGEGYTVWEQSEPVWKPLKWLKNKICGG